MATEQATENELILESIDHVSRTLNRRAGTVKEVIRSEMRDVRQICSSVSDVLTVLARRSSDLGKQQESFVRALQKH